MSDPDEQVSTQSVDVVAELEAMCIALDYDVMSIGPRVWAIHGHIAYDGDILAAVFPSERAAWTALSPLRPRSPGLSAS
jgi:hypothetical protein